MLTELRSDEYGIKESVTVMQPAQASYYMKESVFVPSALAKWLRRYECEGVIFMYECAMGLRDFPGYGCILLDDMGFGKTLQSVALFTPYLKHL